MKIILCMKQVPLKDAQLKIRGDQLWIDEANLNFEINESDHYGLEAALRLKEAHGGEVIVLSVGPSRAKQAIQQALAKGADRAIHVEDDGLARGSPAPPFKGRSKGPGSPCGSRRQSLR